MNSLQQNLLNPNSQPLVIGEFSIRQDEDGRYCINDLHKASGGQEKHKPFNFMRNQQTKDLISEIENEIMMLKSEHHKIKAVNTIKGKGLNQGTFVIKELVYFYAMWISAKFHLMVIRAYDSLVMEWMIGGKQTISPEQAGILYNIVHTRAGENKNLIVQMWSRLKNHFKYSASYRELRAIHFEDAKHYLEVMDLKSKSSDAADSKKADKQFDSKHIESLARHALWLNHWWAEFGGSIRKISPAMGHGIHDHFTFAAEDARQIVGREVYIPIFELAQRHDWHKGGLGYKTLKEVGRLSVNN